MRASTGPSSARSRSSPRVPGTSPSQTRSSTRWAPYGRAFRAPRGSPSSEGHNAEEALAIAVYCALVGEDIRHGLRLAVNHDGPSDTTGSVTGALLGVLHGETALPPTWLSELEGRPTILELADDFAMEMTQGPALHGPTVSSTGWLARYPRT